VKRVFIGRTRTCAQLRSECTEDGMRTYYGRFERSVKEVVELWTRVDVMGRNRTSNETDLNWLESD